MPCLIKEWRVVDICRKKVYKKTMLDGVVYARYDKTFTKFTLKRKDKEDEIVEVESTMALSRAASLRPTAAELAHSVAALPEAPLPSPLLHKK